MERRQSDEANQCMGIIRRQDLEVTPLLFTRGAMGFLMTTESQDLGLTSHPKDSAFLQYSVPDTIPGC